MEKHNLKKFILEFFKDCKITDKNKVLTIKNVQKDFEEFIGKKSPYKFVFSFDLHSKTKNSELITQGSYFLLSIKDFLRDKVKTNLLKLNIKPNLAKLNKDPKFKKLKITKIESKEFVFLCKFYFLSTYESLNQKNQSINKFLIKDLKILDLDLDKFKTKAGDIKEIDSIDLEKEYLLAKKRLTLELNKITKPMKNSLNKKLSKEIKRIKDHYSKQIQEKDYEVKRCEEKIMLLGSKLKHTFYDRDILNIKRNIRESEARLEMLKQKSYKERLTAEENFHIKDEVEKHVLAIKNNLINITLFYYPIYEVTASSKTEKISKKYDPFLDKVF